MKPSCCGAGPGPGPTRLNPHRNLTDTNFPSGVSVGTGLAPGAAYEYLVIARQPSSLLFFISVFVGKIAGSNNIHARHNRYCFGLVRFSWKRDCATRYKFPWINVAHAVLSFFIPSRPTGISHPKRKASRVPK